MGTGHVAGTMIAEESEVESKSDSMNMDAKMRQGLAHGQRKQRNNCCRREEYKDADIGMFRTSRAFRSHGLPCEYLYRSQVTYVSWVRLVKISRAYIGLLNVSMRRHKRQLIRIDSSTSCFTVLEGPSSSRAAFSTVLSAYGKQMRFPRSIQPICVCHRD